MDYEVARRLAPNGETVRRLYLLSGNQCAFPGCTHPIILGDGTYVGELCHISAAEPGGQRFDRTLTNEQRRHEKNLLLLCHDHHVITNDETVFTWQRLREMKEAHEARFERGLASMLESSGINIVNSSVSLGGAAGAAPGAGGGGGGAIGPGARGGDGGAGGQSTRGVLLLNDDIVGLRVRVGEAGTAGSVGTPAGSGQDSVAEVVRKDGTSVEVLRAAGGKSADSMRGEVRVTKAMFADSVRAYGGLISLLGGGWTSYYVEHTPFVLRFGIACLVEAEKDPTGRLFVSIRDPANIEVSGLQQDFDFGKGSVPFACEFLLEATSLGEWSAVFSSGTGEIGRLPFLVSVRDRGP